MSDPLAAAHINGSLNGNQRCCRIALCTGEPTGTCPILLPNSRITHSAARAPGKTCDLINLNRPSWRRIRWATLRIGPLTEASASSAQKWAGSAPLGILGDLHHSGWSASVLSLPLRSARCNSERKSVFSRRNSCTQARNSANSWVKLASTVGGTSSLGATDLAVSGACSSIL